MSKHDMRKPVQVPLPLAPGSRAIVTLTVQTVDSLNRASYRTLKSTSVTSVSLTRLTAPGVLMQQRDDPVVGCTVLWDQASWQVAEPVEYDRQPSGLYLPASKGNPARAFVLTREIVMAGFDSIETS
jgi:hypothetical protein